MQKFVQKFFLSVLAGGWLDLSFGFVSGLYGGSDGKASAYNAGDLSSIPGWGRSPGEGDGYSLVFLPGESHGHRSLAGYRLLWS